MRALARILFALALAFGVVAPAAAQEVRVKDLGRFLGWRDNALVGYGVVVGLGGSGDSPRNAATRQAMRNVLGRLGANIAPEDLQSRNVAVVIVTATLPPSANIGDRIDITVSSIGDARSLVGGTLLMTPLMGPDQKSYALAQGAVVVGGYRFDSDANLRQVNQPASGVVTSGATVETRVGANLLDSGRLTFILDNPDVETANRIAGAVNATFAGSIATVRGPDAVVIDQAASGRDLYALIAGIQGLSVQPDLAARIVVNERTGTIVAGAGVRISSVVISQGDIRVSVTENNYGSQPVGAYGDGVASLVIRNTRLDVSQDQDAVISFPNTTVGDLVEGLHKAHVDTRGIIAILQAMKAAGALHAEILVQ